MCACIEKTGVEEWGIRALAECIDLSFERTSHQKSSFLSVAFAKLATVGHRNLRPQGGITFNWMAFKRNIREFTHAINNPNELLLDAPRPPLQPVFKVIEQFKPSKFDSKSFVEVHGFHIISITPVIGADMPEQILALHYAGQPECEVANSE